MLGVHSSSNKAHPFTAKESTPWAKLVAVSELVIQNPRDESKQSSRRKRCSNSFELGLVEAKLLLDGRRKQGKGVAQPRAKLQENPC